MAEVRAGWVEDWLAATLYKSELSAMGWCHYARVQAHHNDSFRQLARKYLRQIICKVKVIERDIKSRVREKLDTVRVDRVSRRLVRGVEL